MGLTAGALCPIETQPQPPGSTALLPVSDQAGLSKVALTHVPSRAQGTLLTLAKSLALPTTVISLHSDPHSMRGQE